MSREKLIFCTRVDIYIYIGMRMYDDLPAFEWDNIKKKKKKTTRDDDNETCNIVFNITLNRGREKIESLWHTYYYFFHRFVRSPLLLDGIPKPSSEIRLSTI